MSEHSKEPWSVYSAGKTLSISIGKNPNGARPNVVDWTGFDSCDLPLKTQKANAKRIVACVNACAGVSTEKLEAAPSAESITIPLAEYEAMKNGLEDYKRNYINACKGRKDFRNAFREARSEIFRLQESLDKAKEI
jgi:hypothetical protein